MEKNEIENVKYSTSDKKGVLGALEGPCADTISATRNGRRYSDELWEKAFSDPIVEEYFECGGIFGELGHPTDRSETDMEKIAICMPEKPTKGDDGKLYGRWDILDTPNGRILKCLCDYGYKIGISSRGNGEVTEDFNGEESVEPDSYELFAFDAVLLPAVKEARLNVVSESLDRTKNLRTALRESLDKSNADERKIMQETLNKLHIDYGSDETKAEQTGSDGLNEAVDNGSDVLKNLQEALKDNRRLQKNISTLQEQLSVSYAKETRMQRTNENLQDKLSKLSVALPTSKSLKESLIKSSEEIKSLNAKLSERGKVVERLQERLNRANTARKNLDEELQKKDSQIQRLSEEVTALKSKSREAQTSKARAYEKLREDYQALKHETAANDKNTQKRLSEALETNKKYERLINEAFNRYVECKASVVGISVDKLKDSIGNTLSFDKVDRICEQLREQKRNLSKLPFPINESGIKMKSKDSTPSLVANPDDVVDDGLISLLNM